MLYTTYMSKEADGQSAEFQPGNREVLPWEAGGYAIWLQSAELAEKVSPIRDEIAKRYPSVHLVIDGHITLVGNIGKSGEVKDLPQIKIALSAITSKLLSFLRTNRIEVTFNRVESHPSKPSQTLILIADVSEAIEQMIAIIDQDFPSSTTKREVHASIIYNFAALNPVGEEQAAGLLSLVESHLALPITVSFDKVRVMKTVGVPSNWTELESTAPAS